MPAPGDDFLFSFNLGDDPTGVLFLRIIAPHVVAAEMAVAGVTHGCSILLKRTSGPV